MVRNVAAFWTFPIRYCVAAIKHKRDLKTQAETAACHALGAEISFIDAWKMNFRNKSENLRPFNDRVDTYYMWKLIVMQICKIRIPKIYGWRGIYSFRLLLKQLHFWFMKLKTFNRSCQLNASKKLRNSTGNCKCSSVSFRWWIQVNQWSSIVCRRWNECLLKQHT